VVVTASSAMEYAFEGGQLASDASTPAPSVFTGAVVDGLTTGEADRDGDGWVGLTELVGFVTDQVHRVTPNQNPQMWTFGSQGELLIARSRVRRLTAAPLAPELTQAMESPLPAARFGVVDYLRERLYDDDLGQAYAAWQGLRQMIDDDSRKVSEAASEALSTAELRVTPESVELTGTTSAELRLAGPPIALTAGASSSVDWLKLEQEGEVIRLHAEQATPGTHDAVVQLAGPLGDRAVPVRLTVAEVPPLSPKSAPKPKVEKPAPVPAPAPATTPAAAERQPSRGPTDKPPWWLIAVLAAGSGLLIYLNWPGPQYAHYLWKDADNTGWSVYRTWYDPVILSSFVALLVSLLARWAGTVALGVVAGCVAALIQGGLLILVGGISYNETGAWLASTAVAVGLAAALLVVLRPRSWRLRPVPQAAAAIAVVGVVLMLVSSSIKHGDGISFFTVTPFAALHPLVAVALAWSALAAVDARARTWLTAVTVTYSLIGIVGAIPAWTTGQSPGDFLTSVAGSALILIAVLIPGFSPVQRLPSLP
jgi:hypothetical protein